MKMSRSMSNWIHTRRRGTIIVPCHMNIPYDSAYMLWAKRDLSYAYALVVEQSMEFMCLLVKIWTASKVEEK